MKTSTQMLPAVGNRMLPLLVMIAIGLITVAWQPQLDQGTCDPATGQNCAPAQQPSKRKATRTPIPPTFTPTATVTSTATATSTATHTASPVPTASGTSPAPLGQPAAPVPPAANPAAGRSGPAWPLIGGGALLFGAIIVVCFYLLRRPLGLLPAIQDVSPEARETGTIDVRDGGLENFTVNWHDGGLGGATVTFQDPGGFENTIGGKDIGESSGGGVS